jgi:hypothetical protein
MMRESEVSRELRGFYSCLHEVEYAGGHEAHSKGEDGFYFY